jgi:flavin-dependent dehydrogenase
MELWIDRAVIRAGYAWCFPAHDEVRVGVGSFDPADHVKQPTVALAARLDRAPDGYQGNWIPHRIRAATDDAIFYVGDSAGHVLPLSAEGIRFAWHFGIACGRELRAVLEGRQDRSTALRRYHEFAAEHAWKFECLYRLQQAIPRLHPRALDVLVRVCGRRSVSHRLWTLYGRIAPPSAAFPAPAAAREPAHAGAAAA